jgi:hypothetical protein
MSGLDELKPQTRAFYVKAMSALERGGVPFLVGGAHAVAHYTGIVRHTKDLDVYVRPADAARALAALGKAGYRTELTFEHWLGKAFERDDLVDVIFSSGNGLAKVDDAWFEHAVEAEVVGVPAKLCPAEEIIWSKAFILERDRCDVADVAHILRACAERLDWARLVARFGPYWRILLAQLVLFGFIYPGERARVPARLVSELVGRLEPELRAADERRICRGTLLSHTQYRRDIDEWRYLDARLLPPAEMSEAEVERWVRAFEVSGA